MSAKKFTVYKDNEQWIPGRKWFWIKPGESGMGHGPHWSHLTAWLSGWWGTR